MKWCTRMDDRISELQRLRDENLALKSKVADLEKALGRAIEPPKKVNPDVAIPQGSNVTQGYVPHFLGDKHRPYVVKYGWSRQYGHETTVDGVMPQEMWGRKGIRLFSTKKRALQSLQYHAFQYYLGIMKKIAKELEQET